MRNKLLKWLSQFESISFDSIGTYIWANDKENHQQMIGEVRGWGAIQHLFPFNDKGQKQAEEFQDELGKFIAEAIQEKMERDKL